MGLHSSTRHFELAGNLGVVASLQIVNGQKGETEQYGVSDGLVKGPVVGMEQDAEGSIWIVVYNGGLERLRPKRVKMYSND